ncbi:hypothetical protein HUK80_06935 [Flavobacterium sp. MAH-1]|uniref:Uncharacterized protein n=1 Tax=Flavobacterium agri TaxID=2743471 RepID=A0A7Y8Y2E5_9FLAO|nr:hypothetical protein [Flavobacterium agri]NUY80624.1 hypothetical protein [Flavobacterium agri]NYA70648.1 hypothetical protein [Flavobacterium agri]
MQKIIFKFTMVVTSALASHTVETKLQMPQLPKPEIRVEKAKPADSLPATKLECNKKTALS